MPTPKKGESKSDYISRAIPEIMSDTEKDQKQAAGQAYGMWDAAHKQESLVTMKKVGKRDRLGDPTGETFALSVLKNPSSSEMKHSVPRGARGLITLDGDLYVEGYEKQGNMSLIIHGALLEVLEDENIISSTHSAWSTLDEGVTVQRNETTKEFYLGESIYEFALMDMNIKKTTTILKKAKIKNPFLSFVPEGITNIPESEGWSNWTDLGQFLAEEGPNLQESFFTMTKVKPDSFSKKTNLILLQIYKNPTKQEMTNFVAIGARGFITLSGDLYLEGHEESNQLSVVTHGALLTALQQKGIVENPDSGWSSLAEGLTVQRKSNTLSICIGESVVALDRPAISKILEAAKHKNPGLTFEKSSIEDEVNSGDWTDWERMGQALENSISYFSGNRLTEQINLEHAYPLTPDTNDLPGDWRIFKFATEDGTAYTINIIVDSFFDYDDLSASIEAPSNRKFLTINFGVARGGLGDLDFRRRTASSIKEMYQIMTTVMVAVVNTVQEEHALAIAFSADKEEKEISRRKAYRVIAEQAAKYFDWSYAVSDQSDKAESYYVFSSKLTEKEIMALIIQNEAIHATEAIPPEKAIEDALDVVQSLNIIHPTKSVREGISKKYYYKDGGPTRNQNKDKTFTDIESGNAGLELKNGFDLDSRYREDSRIYDIRICESIDDETSIQDFPPPRSLKGRRVRIAIPEEERKRAVRMGVIINQGCLGTIIDNSYPDVPIILLDNKNGETDCVPREWLVSEESNMKESKDYSELLKKMKTEKDPQNLTEFFNDLEEDVGMSANFQAHAPEHMIGSPITLCTSGQPKGMGLASAKRGKVEDDSWDGAYQRTVSHNYIREGIEDYERWSEPNQEIGQLVDYSVEQAPEELSTIDILGGIQEPDLSKADTRYTPSGTRYVHGKIYGSLDTKAFSAEPVDLPDGMYKGKHWAWLARVDGKEFKTTFGIKCGERFAMPITVMVRHNVAYLLRNMDEGTLQEKTSEYKQLEKNKVPLTDEERKLCFERDAVWHYNSSRNPVTGKIEQKVCAVWKSKNPKTGKTTYITNTHRAYNTAPTLKGAISKYHSFIKGTA